MAERDSDYWMGAMAMAVAQATVHPQPVPYLRGAVQRFLREAQPATPELKEMLRSTLKEKP